MAVLAVVACALGGCGQSTSQQVQAKVQQFATAVRVRDATTICDQVLAPVLLTHFTDVGLPCAKAMRIYLASVHDPTLAVGRVVVTGNKAEVITLSGAKGQLGALSAIQLINTSNGWRVYHLGSPLLPGQAKKAASQAKTTTGQAKTTTGQAKTTTGPAKTTTAPAKTTTAPAKKPKK
jgi:hypothetical protein